MGPPTPLHICARVRSHLATCSVDLAEIALTREDWERVIVKTGETDEQDAKPRRKKFDGEARSRLAFAPVVVEVLGR